MENYLMGFINKIFDIVPTAAVIGITFITAFYVSGSAYKKIALFKSRKLNLGMYVVTGLVVLGIISYWIGHNTSAPCISSETDSLGTTCVEYDSDYKAPTKREQEQASGAIFAMLFPAFLYSVYLIRKEELEEK